MLSYDVLGDKQTNPGALGGFGGKKEREYFLTGPGIHSDAVVFDIKHQPLRRSPHPKFDGMVRFGVILRAGMYRILQNIDQGGLKLFGIQGIAFILEFGLNIGFEHHAVPGNLGPDDPNDLLSLAVTEHLFLVEKESDKWVRLFDMAKKTEDDVIRHNAVYMLSRGKEMIPSADIKEIYEYVELNEISTAVEKSFGRYLEKK